MNERERYVQAILFGAPDRVPLQPGSARKSTRENWLRQGLPPDQEMTYTEYAYRLSGGTLPWPRGRGAFEVNERMIPQFEEKIIEERDRTHIVQDWKGNICEIGKEFGVEYLRNGIDFVTRSWIKCPVATRKDWADMMRRYDPEDPSRITLPGGMTAEALAHRDWPATVHFSGPFWQLREWLGFENLCMLFYDDPDWVREMIAFWEDYILRLMKKVFEHCIPDEVYLSEDMAYKKFSMTSPEMTREFLLPTWTRWGEAIRSAGVPIYAMDSDGFIGELIPLWSEAGIRVCDPIEVAAGNDILEFRRRFGRSMAYRGGVDKRAMAKGGGVIETEIERLKPLIDDGGYIPSCDHGIPPDVAWPAYVHYVGLLAKATGWLSLR